MDDRGWERLGELFDAALALPQSARELLLQGLEDRELRAELESLLRAHSAAGGFLEEPAGALPQPSPDVLAGGTRLGQWRLQRLIGRGGMGEVYEAERAAGDFEQRVAIKLTRLESAAPVERFHVERQLLARLDHPGIARLLDGGVAADGRPFLVMEYVDGPPIDAHCDANGAPLALRAELFLQICDAVAYAHRHLVVHRDLKCANVLVDGGGRTRLLDFGIAKLLDASRVDDDGAAGTTRALMTPEYAAPEQLAGEPITTATDVYSLGVLLFELLTGRRPWEDARQPLARAVQMARERTAPRASLRAQTTEQRPIAPRELVGDWDAIIAKCLRSEPQHRYATVEALAGDIRRALRGAPVAARGDARLYVVGRLLRRYRWATAAVVALFAVLSVGIAATAWQARRAQQEAARAAAARDFLIGVFSASDPRIAQDRPRGEVTARELLDASVERIDRHFSADPAARVELLGIAAALYAELDEEDRYRELHRRHVASARAHYGEDHPVVISALLAEAAHAHDALDTARAVRLLETLDGSIRRAGADASALRARWWLVRGQTLFGDSTRTAEQLAALRRAADLYADVAPRDSGRVTALADLGTLHANRLEFDVARRWYRAAIAAADTVDSRNDAELATIYGNLGMVAQQRGDFAGAEAAYARAEQVILRTQGKASRAHWLHAANRARAAHLGGERERAARLFEVLRSEIPADAPYIQAMQAREIHASCLAAEGRPEEAVPLLQSVERYYALKSAFDFELPRVRLTLGDAYERAGRLDDARTTLHAALEHRIRHGAADSQPVLAARERWGRFLLARGEIAAADAEFTEVVRQARGRKLAHVALAHGGLARVALARGDVDAARAASLAALATFDAVEGFRDVRMGPYLWIVHSEVLRLGGDPTAALDWATRALEARRRYDDPRAASIGEARAAQQLARSAIAR